MMINNRKGFGKFEVLTMIVLLLCMFAYLMYSILGGANKQKYTTMKDNANRLGNVTATNISSFRNQDNVKDVCEVVSKSFYRTKKKVEYK